MNQPLEISRLYEQMVRRIKDEILKGELKAGDQLPNERQLAENFGVSRTVVREAIKTLKHEGLIEVRPGLGSFIVDATGEALTQSLGLMMTLSQKGKLNDIVEFREMIEPEIAALAAVRATEVEIGAMEHAIEGMDEHLSNIERYSRKDHDFHLALAIGTKNQIIPKFISSIVDLLHELRTRIALVEGARERGQMHHRRILQAVRSKDPQAARRAMQEHLRQVREDAGTDN